MIFFSRQLFRFDRSLSFPDSSESGGMRNVSLIVIYKSNVPFSAPLAHCLSAQFNLVRPFESLGETIRCSAHLVRRPEGNWPEKMIFSSLVCVGRAPDTWRARNSLTRNQSSGSKSRNVSKILRSGLGDGISNIDVRRLHFYLDEEAPNTRVESRIHWMPRNCVN